MFRKIPFIMLACLLAALGPVRGQNDVEPGEEVPAEQPRPGDSAGPHRFWQANVGGGHFMVALSRIVSVSRHQYVLDGTLIVDEVTVDTEGEALTRFYHISPISDALPGNAAAALASRGREVVDKVAQRTGTDVQDMVVKKYPDTTHARSIEYRVSSAQELASLYSSVRSAWESGRGRQFSTARK